VRPLPYVNIDSIWRETMSMSVKLIGMAELAYLDVVEIWRSAVRVLVNVSRRYWNMVMCEGSDKANRAFTC
jgi:hypothetical protein